MKIGFSKRAILFSSLAALSVLSQKGFLDSFQQEHRLSSELPCVETKRDDTPSVETKRDDITNILNTDQSGTFPLIIGAGQGTTGTRSIQKAVCKLGIPSVHYNSACFEGSVPFNNTMIFQHAELGVKAHVKVIQTWKELRDCLGKARKRGNVCAKAEDLLTLVRKYVTEVIQSGVGAVHDTPYTMMVPYVIKVARETRNSEPILPLTERNPQEWAARRVQTHELTPQLACKDPRGAFDIDYCLDSGLNASDMFHAYTDYIDSAEQDEYVSLLEKSMDIYQQSMRELKPVYMVNMFESKKPIESNMMEQSIWNVCKPRLSLEAVNELNQRQTLGGLKRHRASWPKTPKYQSWLRQWNLKSKLA
jgi:hypothetical protein